MLVKGAPVIAKKSFVYITSYSINIRITFLLQSHDISQI